MEDHGVFPRESQKQREIIGFATLRSTNINLGREFWGQAGRESSLSRGEETKEELAVPCMTRSTAAWRSQGCIRDNEGALERK